MIHNIADTGILIVAELENATLELNQHPIQPVLLIVANPENQSPLDNLEVIGVNDVSIFREHFFSGRQIVAHVPSSK